MQGRMMSGTFTNWLTGLQNLTHVGRMHTRAPVILHFLIIVTMIKSTSLMTRWGRRGGPGVTATQDHGFGQRVREVNEGENEL